MILSYLYHFSLRALVRELMWPTSYQTCSILTEQFSFSWELYYIILSCSISATLINGKEVIYLIPVRSFNPIMLIMFCLKSFD